MIRTTFIAIVILIISCSVSFSAQPGTNEQNQTDSNSVSYYPIRPEDPQAVYFTKENFPDIHADGTGDDSDVLQEAVSNTRGGIIFIPEGRYRISKTIIVGGGTRIIGYGKKRPVIVLAANSPNFQWGTGKYMFHFAQSSLPTGGSGAGGGMMGGMMGGGMMGGRGGAAPGGMMGGRGEAQGERRGGERGTVPGAGNIQGAIGGQGGDGAFGGRGGDAGFGGTRGGGRSGGQRGGGNRGGGMMGGMMGGRGGRGGLFNDALETTFYGGMDNIDIEIENGNPAAIAIRFHVAQHSFLRHMNFNITNAYAAIEDVGNQTNDIHVNGGKYGIITRRTSPVWQFLLMDSHFENQTEAGIQTMEAGFTMIRCSFDNMPVAVQLFIGEVEQLYGRDLRMSNITFAGFKHGNPDNFHATVNFENVACTNVPAFYRGNEVLRVPSQHYVMDKFSVGLEIGPDGREQGVMMKHKEHPVSQPAPIVPTDIPALPPMSEWINANSVGISQSNDGQTNSQAIKDAMKQHKAIYFPSGRYSFAEPVRLEKDTAIIGLHPSRTTFSVQGGGAADGERIGGIIAPKGGKNIVSSISVSPGGFAGVLWMASPESLLDDVSFGGGGGGGRGGRGGTANTDTTFRNPDLMITDGGGGIFRGNWPHGTSSSEGLVITNTSTKGKIYQMSVEHHYRVELVLQNVENWEFYALQTEEENPAGHEANSMHMDNCKNILFANTYMYRVSRCTLPAKYGMIIRNSDNIRFENMKVFAQTRLAFDTAVFAEDSGVEARQHFFTNFVVNKDMKAPEPLPLPQGLFQTGTKVEKLATGYTNSTSLTTDTKGTLFFSDDYNKNIYRWNEANKQAEQIAQTPDMTQVMAFVEPSTLLMIGRGSTSGCPVYSLDLSQNGATPQVVNGAPDALFDTKLMIPLGIHNMMSVLDDLMENRNYVYSGMSNTAVATIIENAPRAYYYAPGTKTAIKAGGTWRPLPQSANIKAFAPGDKFYVACEDDGKTYRAELLGNETLKHCVFVERGGMSAIEDSAGNVYIASDQVYIYNSDGEQIGILEIPERPGSLTFGGTDKRTLYIGARSSLYSIRTAIAGK
ncbi:MAG: hypothetical protein JW787_10350 [Sedimentisphaerales bacterium]|nr:hypothetical protein [Sedimentisphaerales bacterium]